MYLLRMDVRVAADRQYHKPKARESGRPMYLTPKKLALSLCAQIVIE